MNTVKHPFEQEEIMAYLDGELEPEQAATVAVHLEQCAACRALAADLRSVSQRLLAWQVEPAPVRATERVMVTISEGMRPGERWALRQAVGGSRRIILRPAVWVPAGAFVVLLLVIGLSNLSVRHKLAPLSWESRVDLAQVKLASEAEQPQRSMIVQTASLTIVAQKFEEARGAMEQIVSRHQAYVAELTISQQPGTARVLAATLRVPANQLEAALAELRKLGNVEQESRSAEDVSRQYVDLVARLKNARATEQRLLDLLRQRTGKVGDVLEVEKEISRIREEIEKMEAERKSIERKVNYATIHLRLGEEYRAELGAPRTSTRTRLWNALVDGYRTLAESVLEVVLFLINYGPTLLFWALILFWPARLAWRRWRAAVRAKQVSLGA